MIIDGFLLKKTLNFGSLNHWQNLFKQREKKKRVGILLSGGVSMDCMATREKNTELDLEKGLTITEEEDQIKNPFSSLKNKAQMLLSKLSLSDNVSSDERVSLSGDASDSGSSEAVNKEGQDNKGVVGKESSNDNKVGKEKRNKKAPKPPRPPKAPTLDAADRRLIKELAELARLKRAKIERMKALKKMKATKGVSSNTTILAMILIIILLIVIIYHGTR